MHGTVDKDLLASAYRSVSDNDRCFLNTPPGKARISRALAPHMNGFHDSNALHTATHFIPRVPGTASSRGTHNGSARGGGTSRTLSRLANNTSATGGFLSPGFRSSEEMRQSQRAFILQDKDMPRCPSRSCRIDGALAPHGLMETLGTPRIESFRATVPPGGGNMNHPGLVLPSVAQTSQALFGAGCNKAGTATALHMASATLPGEAPRYLTHDAVSMTSSVYSNFRKTSVAWTGENSVIPCSEYCARYRSAPPRTPVPMQFRTRNMPRNEKHALMEQMYGPLMGKIRDRPRHPREAAANGFKLTFAEEASRANAARRAASAMG